MSEYLPKEVREGLELARRPAPRMRRMTVRVGGHDFTILRHWQGGFTLAAEDAPKMRGLVDLYDGPTLVSRCLVVASDEDAPGERAFEVKRETRPATGPALDYERSETAPLLLG